MKKNDNNASTPEFDRNRELAVILERVHTDVKAIAEGHSLLNEKFDKLSAKTDMLYDEFGRQREIISIIKIDVRSLKEGQVRLEGRQAKLEDGQTNLGANFTTLNNKFDAFSLDIKTILSTHDKRLLRLEAKISPKKIMAQWTKEYIDILKGLHVEIRILVKGMSKLRKSFERLERSFDRLEKAVIAANEEMAPKIPINNTNSDG